MTGQEIIRLEHVEAGYTGKTVFRDVSLGIGSRDYVGVIGPNGGGKTTLVRLILGLMRPRRGSVRYLRGGNEVGTLTMGYLPQHNAIDPKFPISVSEVVLSGLDHNLPWSGPYREEHRERAAAVLRRLGIERLQDRHIGTLSGGQMQRVLLGRALVSKPDIIVLDEPNTYVDRVFQRQMYELLSAVSQECAVVFVTHDVQAVIENAHRALMVNGGVVEKPASQLTDADIERCFGCAARQSGAY